MPAKAQDELKQQDKYVAITKQFKNFAFQTDAQSTKYKNRLISQKRKFEKAELDKIRSSQFRMHPKNREKLEKHEMYQDRSRFGRFQHIMPERRRFFNALFYMVNLRSEIAISAIENLYIFLKNDCLIAYQPSLQPVDGKCPRKEYNAEFDS